MLKSNNSKYIESRCALLQQLGFEILHEDSCVKVPVEHCEFPVEVIIVDFSAIEEEHFLSFAISQIYKAGFSDGQKDIQGKMKQLISGETEDETIKR